MDINEYQSFQANKQRISDLDQASEAVKKAGLSTMATAFNFAMNWKDPKVMAQMFTLMFNALQYGDALIKYKSLTSPDTTTGESFSDSQDKQTDSNTSGDPKGFGPGLYSGERPTGPRGMN